MAAKAAALAFLVILASSVFPSTESAAPPPLTDDAVGLLLFKSGLADPLGALATWQDDPDLPSSPCSTWAHLRCSASSGRVISVDVSSLRLSGRVNRGLAKLSSLSSLSLSTNNFSGELPAGILSLLPALRHLDLSGNAFSGNLTAAVPAFRRIESLNLSANSLSGDFPAGILNLTSLTSLDLSGNSLTGSLPEEIPPAGWGRLKVLRLRGNRLTGKIPGWLFKLGLEELDLAGNGISGEIPAGSPRLYEALRLLDLAGNGISGEIPAEGALWVELREVNLSGNSLRSRIPAALGYLRNLTVVDLRGCGLYGNIPADICDSGGLAVLQLDGNSLSGPIPPEIANCTNLHLMGLARNQLNGSIPAAVARLAKLEILNLEFNNLSGEIPPSLGRMTSLLAVNLSHNHLVGRLPAGGVFTSLDPSAIAANLGLCSPLVVDQPCILDVPKPLVLDPHRYPSRPSPSPAGVAAGSSRRFLSISVVVALAAAVVIAIGVAVVTALNAAASRRHQVPTPSATGSSSRSGEPAVGKLVLFGGTTVPEDILEKAVELGRGTLGPVYRAMAEPGKPIAVRRLNVADVIPYHDEFDREVRALARARHPNLLSLKGYFWTPQVQLLVADFASGGSLESRLRFHPPLTWPERFRIAAGAAAGLAHLHRAFRPPIVHYNFKPSNVLLSAQGEALVADFGLARLLSTRATYPQGGSGYVAPEMACRSLRVNERCDVYSFGVVLMELVTGRMTDEGDDVAGLVEEVRERVEGGMALECVDRSMGAFPEEEVLPVLKLALVCASQVPSSRPSMAEVVQILQVIGTPVATSSSAAGVTASSSF